VRSYSRALNVSTSSPIANVSLSSARSIQLLCSASLLAVVVGTTPSDATTLNINFLADVNFAQGSSPSALPSGLGVGSKLTGTIQYEANDAIPYGLGLPDIEKYFFSATQAGSGIKLSYGTTTWASGPSMDVTVVNDTSYDGMGYNAAVNDSLHFYYNSGSHQSSQSSFPGGMGDNTIDVRVFAGNNNGAPVTLTTSTALPTSASASSFSATGVNYFSGAGIIDTSNATGTGGYSLGFTIDPATFVIGKAVPPPSQAPAFAFPLTGLDYVFTNTIAGGNAFDGIPDPNHYPGAAYYSVDFDVNQDQDKNQVTDKVDVLAAAAGTIVSISGFGKCGSEPVCAIIDHGNGYYTEYREFSTLNNLSIGMSVAAGDILGTLIGGNNRNPVPCGGANQPSCDHLHFQVLYDINGNGPSTGDSSIAVTQLQGITVGGKQLVNFALAPNGTQAVDGFIANRGKVSPGAEGVLSYSTSNQFGIGVTAPGQTIVNGPISLDVHNTLSIGTSSNGEMYVVNGASVSAQSILLGKNSGGQGYLRIYNNSIVDGGSFIGIGASSPTGSTMNSGVGIVEVESGGQLKATTLRVGGAGSLRYKNGTTQGSLFMTGGVLLLGSSPGIGTHYGDFTMTGGILDIEFAGTTLGSYDVFNIFGNAAFLGGKINFSFLNGFLPKAGDTFNFLNVSGSTNFGGTKFNFLGLPTGIKMSVLPLGSGGFIANVTDASIAPVPLPATALLLIGALGVLGAKRRARNWSFGSSIARFVFAGK